jgi:flavin-dependent dehydrogenase
MLGRALLDLGGVLQLATRFVSAARTAEGFTLLTRGPAGNVTLRARMLVDATGRAAAVARRLGYRTVRRDRLVALMARTEPRAQCMPMIEASRQGWWYSASLPCGRVQAVYFTDADLLEKAGPRSSWQASLCQAPHTRARLGHAGARLEPRGASAHTQSLAGLVPGVIGAGDAALALDPLSSAGLTEAIADSTRVAQTVDATLAGDPSALERHGTRLQRSLLEHLAQRAHYYGLAQRFVDEPFWQRRTLARVASSVARVLPSTVLRISKGVAAPSLPLAALTPDIDLGALRELSNEPRPARLIADDLRKRYGYHDAEVVRLLQALVGAGELFPT